MSASRAWISASRARSVASSPRGGLVGAMRDLLRDLEGALRLAAHQDRGAFGGRLAPRPARARSPTTTRRRRPSAGTSTAPHSTARSQVASGVSKPVSAPSRRGRPGAARAQVGDQADEDGDQAERADVHRPVGGRQRRRDPRLGGHQRGRERHRQARIRCPTATTPAPRPDRPAGTAACRPAPAAAARAAPMATTAVAA